MMIRVDNNAKNTPKNIFSVSLQQVKILSQNMMENKGICRELENIGLKLKELLAALLPYANICPAQKFVNNIYWVKSLFY